MLDARCPIRTLRHPIRVTGPESTRVSGWATGGQPAATNQTGELAPGSSRSCKDVLTTGIADAGGSPQ